jgi:cytochrome P450
VATRRPPTRPRPPGPPLGPVATIRAFRRDPISLLERAAAFGDVSILRTPRARTFVVNHPDLVWDVLVSDHRSFRKGPTIEAARRVLGDGLLTSEGEDHRRDRRLIQPMFQPTRLRAYVPTIERLTDTAIDRWRDGQELDVHAEMSRLTLSIVVEALFGADLPAADAVTVSDALTEVLAQYRRVFSPLLVLTERLPLPANRRFDRAVGVFDAAVYRLIDRRRAEGATGDDLLSTLIRAHDEDGSMTAERVRDHAVTLFLAGHETTSNALSWAWFLLARNPDVAEALRADVDATARAGDAANGSTLATAVLDEAMRLFPPAWAIGRRASRTHEAAGTTIGRGSVVVVSPWLLHRDARWWSRPRVFDPHRFLGPGADRPRAAYLPFGAGPRMCVGEPFARLEAVVILSRIARAWRLESDPGLDVELQPAITLRPRGGIPMRAVARR